MDLSPHVLDQFAVQAAAGYSASGDLDLEISKIAEEAELTEQQIAALVPEANVELNRRLHGSMADKQFAFKTASVQGVKKILSSKTGPKLASFTATGFLSLEIDGERSKTAGDSAPVEVQYPDWIRDPQTRVKTVANCLKTAADYLNKYAEECRQGAVEAKYKVSTAFAGVKYEAQQAMRSDGVKFASICEAAIAHNPECKEAFIQIFGLVKTECEKTASPVEVDLLKFDPKELDGKDEIGTRISNGSHPIMVHLDDLISGANLVGAYNASCEGFRDRASAAVSAIHDLNTHDDVDAYVANEIQQFANAVKVGACEAMEACIKFGQQLKKTSSLKDQAGGIKDLYKMLKGPIAQGAGSQAAFGKTFPNRGRGLESLPGLIPSVGALLSAGNAAKSVQEIGSKDLGPALGAGGNRRLGVSNAI